MHNMQLKAILTADDKISGTFKKVGQNSEGLADKIAGTTRRAALAFGTMGAAFTLVAKKATDFAVDYVKSAKTISRITGENVADSSKLLAVTKRMGLTSQQVGMMFGVFSKQIVKTSEETGKARLEAEKLRLEQKKLQRDYDATTKEIAKNGDKTGDLKLHQQELKVQLKDVNSQLNAHATALDKLNIKTVDASGKTRDFSDILFDVADRFKSMKDGPEKTAIALELFGRSGKDMIKFLNQGSDGITAMEKAADKLGLTLTPTTVQAVADLVEQQKLLAQNSDAAKLKLAQFTTPVLTTYYEWINKAFLAVDGLSNSQQKFIAVTVAMAGPVLNGTALFLGMASSVAQVASALGRARTVALLFNAVGFGTIIGAAAAAAILIKKSADKTAKAWENAGNAIESAGRSNDQVYKRIKASSLSAEQKARRIQEIASSSNATDSTFSYVLKEFGGILSKAARFNPVKPKHNAAGTNYFSGGQTWVGERGPELVNLPRGSQVIPNNKLGGSTGNVNFNVNIGLYAGTQMEKRKIAKELFAAYEQMKGYA